MYTAVPYNGPYELCSMESIILTIKQNTTLIKQICAECLNMIFNTFLLLISPY